MISKYPVAILTICAQPRTLRFTGAGSKALDAELELLRGRSSLSAGHGRESANWSLSLVSSLARLPPAKECQRWKGWVESWIKQDWIETGSDAVGTLHIRFSYEKLHFVLGEIPKKKLVAYSAALQGGRWRRRTLVQVARIALYCEDEELFSQYMDYLPDSDDWLHLLGHDPVIDAAALIPDKSKERHLRVLSEYALGLRVAAPRIVMQSRMPCIVPYQVALAALSGDHKAAELALQETTLVVGTNAKLSAAVVLLKLATNDIDSARKYAAQALALSKGKRKYPNLAGPLSIWSALCALTGSPEQRALAELLLVNPKRTGQDVRSGDQSLLALRSWMTNE